MSLVNGYTKITSPDSNCVVYVMKVDGTPVANIDRYIEWPDLITAVQSGLVFSPPVNALRKQRPFEPTPATLWSGTTWMNVSEKAWGYELSASGWVARINVHDWSETDYAATDTVSGGTYDGETVNTIFNPEGKFEAIEGDRSSGVTAKTFQTGFETDVMQQITGEIIAFGGNRAPCRTGDSDLSGVFSAGTAGTDDAMDNGSLGGSSLVFDSADSVSPQTAKTNEYETRPEYFTTRIWVRTA